MTAEKLIAVVEQSPQAVAVHDKTAWMSIFAQNHVVEDPVGSRPHLSDVGGAEPHRALSRFYDTFIAPNKLAFDVKQDVVCGQHVVRDLAINLQMSDKVHAQVPMHLLYELSEEAGDYKVSRLAAHWEFMPMIMQLLKQGFAALPVLASLTVRMLKLQGVSGAMGFAKAAFNVGQQGKQQALNFERALAQKDLAALQSLFVDTADRIHFPYGTAPISTAELLKKSELSLSLSKLLVSGDAVSASIEQTLDGEVKQGVLIFKFDRSSLKFNQVYFYI